jgi:hypothetical protein
MKNKKEKEEGKGPRFFLNKKKMMPASSKPSTL